MPHILVIEDDAQLRRMLSRILRLDGYTVSEAADGSSGLACWHEGGAEVVITDLHMAGMGGIEVILQLRAQAPALPIIAMCSAASSDADRLRDAQLLGKVIVLQRPFTFGTLTALVRSILAAVRQQQA